MAEEQPRHRLSLDEKRDLLNDPVFVKALAKKMHEDPTFVDGLALKVQTAQEKNLYISVGKVVVQKFLYLLGTLAIAGYVWAVSKGIIRIKD
jgi:hypothetical protein